MFAFILLSSFLPLLPLVKRVSVMGQRQTQTEAFLSFTGLCETSMLQYLRDLL